MATILPFQAVRPARDKATLVSSLAFDTYSAEEIEHILQTNPYSYLQIINAGYLPGKKVSADNRFRKIRARYREFLQAGILVKEEVPGLYLYELSKDKQYYLGFFGATSTYDYQNNIIRKHEDTLSRREQIFARFLKEVQFNAEPVLMMYPDNPAIMDLMERERQEIPEYNFVTSDGYAHRLWLIGNPDTIRQVQQLFEPLKALYIADGHHRTASSQLLAAAARTANTEHTGQEAYNYFMSYLLPESSIKISQYNRMVRDLNGLTKEGFLRDLSGAFEVSHRGSEPWYPVEKQQFSMYLDGVFYSLRLKAGAWEFTDALSKLDSHILYNTLLKPILGIEDLRNNKRLRYAYGQGSQGHMKRQIDGGEFKVGFGMVPITISEIKAIADAGQVMPPKSTYIEPKLRSGLTFYEF